MRRRWGARREVFHQRFREYVDGVSLSDAAPSPDLVLAAMKGGESAD